MRQFATQWVRIFALPVVVLLFSCGVARADDASATLYKAKCAMCHAPDGSGSTAMGKQLKVADLGSADVQKESDTDLTNDITNGKGGGKMPAYKGKITDDQIKGLVSYIRTLAKKH
jgi:mono/diheme cytochrome c family protein